MWSKLMQTTHSNQRKTADLFNMKHMLHFSHASHRAKKNLNEWTVENEKNAIILHKIYYTNV